MILNFDITWKLILCGFFNEVNEKILMSNNFISFIVESQTKKKLYLVFKIISKGKQNYIITLC